MKTKAKTRAVKTKNVRVIAEGDIPLDVMVQAIKNNMTAIMKRLREEYDKDLEKSNREFSANVAKRMKEAKTLPYTVNDDSEVPDVESSDYVNGYHEGKADSAFDKAAEYRRGYNDGIGLTAPKGILRKIRSIFS